MDDPQYLVTEADDLDDSQQEGNESEDGIDQIRDQDRFLPIANVAKIMKMSIPENAKIAKDAKECVQECVSEFVSFVTSEASDRCHQEKRKTINGEDLLFAMSSLGFDSYVEPLKLFLTKYRDSIKGEKSVVQKRETFDGDGAGLDQMGATPENVTGSVAAFVTTGGQNINIIHGGTTIHQEILPQHQQQLSSQIYTAAYHPAQSDITQVHFQSQ